MTLYRPGEPTHEWVILGSLRLTDGSPPDVTQLLELVRLRSDRHAATVRVSVGYSAAEMSARNVRYLIHALQESLNHLGPKANDLMVTERVTG